MYTLIWQLSKKETPGGIPIGASWSRAELTVSQDLLSWST